MVKGDGTEFNWTISHLQDCNIELLNWINDNIADKLYAPSDVDPGDGPEIAYEIINEGEPDEMGVMTVRGRIRPDVDIATMLIDMDDAYSESPAISVGLYGPNISAPQISLDPWPMVGAEGTYEIQEVNDATNYTIWVTDPGDTDSSMQSGLGRTYAFTPSVTGWHTIHVEVTPYTGDLAHVETYEQTFYVNP